MISWACQWSSFSGSSQSLKRLLCLDIVLYSGWSALSMMGTSRFAQRWSETTPCLRFQLNLGCCHQKCRQMLTLCSSPDSASVPNKYIRKTVLFAQHGNHLLFTYSCGCEADNNSAAADGTADPHGQNVSDVAAREKTRGGSGTKYLGCVWAPSASCLVFPGRVVLPDKWGHVSHLLVLKTNECIKERWRQNQSVLIYWKCVSVHES